MVSESRRDDLTPAEGMVMLSECVFVHGPARCGKTTNAEQIMRFFGFERWFESSYVAKVANTRLRVTRLSDGKPFLVVGEDGCENLGFFNLMRHVSYAKVMEKIGQEKKPFPAGFEPNKQYTESCVSDGVKFSFSHWEQASPSAGGLIPAGLKSMLQISLTADSRSCAEMRLYPSVADLRSLGAMLTRTADSLEAHQRQIGGAV